MKRLFLPVLLIALVLTSLSLVSADDSFTPASAAPICSKMGDASSGGALNINCTDADRDISRVDVQATAGVGYQVKYDQSSAHITIQPPLGYWGGSLSWAVIDKAGNVTSGRLEWPCESCFAD